MEEANAVASENLTMPIFAKSKFQLSLARLSLTVASVVRQQSHDLFVHPFVPKTVRSLFNYALLNSASEFVFELSLTD